jgi:hypothetical protein
MKRTISPYPPLLLLLAVTVGFRWAAFAAPPVAERDLKKLTILQQDYPRVFFFRAAETRASRGKDFETWDTEFNRLMGIMGKCLDEEVSGRETHNPDFFSRFKQRHPQQVVLLHFNGRARDPRFHAEHYFPGHWVYRQAVRITADVPAEAGETVIHVSDAQHFRVQPVATKRPTTISACSASLRMANMIGSMASRSS